eukprot:1749812-Pyramimonas_sp.AAC.1
MLLFSGRPSAAVHGISARRQCAARAAVYCIRARGVVMGRGMWGCSLTVRLQVLARARPSPSRPDGAEGDGCSWRRRRGRYQERVGHPEG